MDTQQPQSGSRKRKRRSDAVALCLLLGRVSGVQVGPVCTSTRCCCRGKADAQDLSPEEQARRQKQRELRVSCRLSCPLRGRHCLCSRGLCALCAAVLSVVIWNANSNACLCGVQMSCRLRSCESLCLVHVRGWLWPQPQSISCHQDARVQRLLGCVLHQKFAFSAA